MFCLQEKPENEPVKSAVKRPPSPQPSTEEAAKKKPRLDTEVCGH